MYWLWLSKYWYAREVNSNYTKLHAYIYIYTDTYSGPGSQYTDWLRSGRSGIESRWGWDFPSIQTGPGAHPAFCKMGNGSFPGIKCGRAVLLTTHPLLVPRSWKSRAIPLPTLWATPGLWRDHFTFSIYPYMCVCARARVCVKNIRFVRGSNLGRNLCLCLCLS